ncbi:MAG TPA: metallophosphoesterase family protein [Gaiellaceae bacterium]|nr:metallophosphoesterase family protein [Gaiellaceae bacterium]
MARVAALYDVHGNPAALEAVLAEAGEATLVFGGDLAAGPVPAETLDRIRELVGPSNTVLQAPHGSAEAARGEAASRSDEASNTLLLASGSALAIRGNADRELLGGPGGGLVDEWVLAQLDEPQREFLAALPETVQLDVAGVGRVLFCHGSPRGDEEMILRTTPDEWLRDMLEGVRADVVVCGHTHMQFDRTVDGIRVVNAGSVGLAYGGPGAHWLELGPDVVLRQTAYDQEAFADRVTASDWPEAARFAEENIRNHPSEEEALAFFEPIAEQQRDERYPGSK